MAISIIETDQPVPDDVVSQILSHERREVNSSRNPSQQVIIWSRVSRGSDLIG